MLLWTIAYTVTAVLLNAITLIVNKSDNKPNLIRANQLWAKWSAQTRSDGINGRPSTSGLALWLQLTQNINFDGLVRWISDCAKHSSSHEPMFFTQYFILQYANEALWISGFIDMLAVGKECPVNRNSWAEDNLSDHSCRTPHGYTMNRVNSCVWFRSPVPFSEGKGPIIFEGHGPF